MRFQEHAAFGRNECQPLKPVAETRLKRLQRWLPISALCLTGGVPVSTAMGAMPALSTLDKTTESRLEQSLLAYGYGGVASSGISSDAESALPQEADATANTPLWQQLGANLKRLNPPLAVVLDGSLAVFTAPPSIQGGVDDPSRSGFNLQDVKVVLDADVNQYFSLYTNLAFGSLGGELREAYGAARHIPGGFQLRAGQILTAFGRLNPTHHYSWNFEEQPLVFTKFFGPRGSVARGLEASWIAPLPWHLELIGSATSPAGRSYFDTQDIGVTAPNQVLVTASLKQSVRLSAAWTFGLGLSGQEGPNPSGRTRIVGADVYLRLCPERRSVTLQAEVAERQRVLSDRTLDDIGAYGQVVWQFDPRWETGVRGEFVTGSAGGSDDLDGEYHGIRTRYTAMVTYAPAAFSRFRLQGSIDHPWWMDSPNFSVMLAVELIAGRMGTHPL